MNRLILSLSSNLKGIDLYIITIKLFIIKKNLLISFDHKINTFITVDGISIHIVDRIYMFSFLYSINLEVAVLFYFMNFCHYFDWFCDSHQLCTLSFYLNYENKIINVNRYECKWWVTLDCVFVLGQPFCSYDWCSCKWEYAFQKHSGWTCVGKRDIQSECTWMNVRWCLGN